MKIKLSKLKPNPVNDEIYSSTDLTDLKNSIKYNGQLEPICVNKKNMIISGHRRFYAIKQLGIKECEVSVQDYKSEIIGLIEHNRHRVKSVQDILNEGKWLEKEYKKIIGRGKRTDLIGKGKQHTHLEIANKIGVSTTKLKKIKSINNYEPSLLNDIDKGKLTVNSAYEIVRNKYILNGEKKSDDEVFKDKFSKLLNEHNPKLETINDVLKKKYPYSFQLLVQTSQKYVDKRDELIEHLDFLKSMNVNQELLYKKQKEVQSLTFNQKLVKECEDRMWMPSNLSNKPETISEIEQIEPVLEIVDGKDSVVFNILRVMIHSMSYDVNPGRHMKVIVKDKSSDRYLGVITLASDFPSLQVRDDYIGWSDYHKYEKGKLNNTSVASSIVPVQPWGYNFLGGKLIACLSTTSPIRNEWKKRYGDVLVGNTTTALFGNYSMYNSIPHWKNLGHSKGTVLLKPDKEHYQYWLNVIREFYEDDYKDKMTIDETSPKQKILNLIYDILGIDKKKYQNEFYRGVYFSMIYKNGGEFLRDEIKESKLELDEKFEYDYIMNWWKEKASRRYFKLYEENNLSHTNYWFNDIKKEDVEQYLSTTGVLI